MPPHDDIPSVPVADSCGCQGLIATGDAEEKVKELAEKALLNYALSLLLS
jgi:hypothetical protein